MQLKNILNRKNWFKLILLLIVFLTISTLTSTSPHDVHAETIDELYEELEEIEKRLAEIRKKQQDLNESIEAEEELQGDLAAQINNLSNNIQKLELQIEEKETDISKMQTEIKIYEEEITEARYLIEDIEKDVEVLETTAGEIVTTLYIDSKTNTTLDILLTTNKGGSFFSQVQYHTALGNKEQNTLSDLGEKKSSLKDEKTKLEEKKLEIEKLNEQIAHEKKELEKDQEQLAAQKSQKNALLNESIQNVETYNQILENLSEEEQKKIAQQNIIKQEIFNKTGNISSGSYVVKGTRIAWQGDSGYSFGEHLHFTMLKNGQQVLVDGVWRNPNPRTLLPNISNCIGSGSEVRWPLDCGKFVVTSEWGYRWGKFHDAIDIAYYWQYQGSQDYILAAHDGWVTYGSSPCPYAACNGDLNYAIICENKDNCNDGFKSAYYHIDFF